MSRHVFTTPTRSLAVTEQLAGAGLKTAPTRSLAVGRRPSSGGKAEIGVSSEDGSYSQPRPRTGVSSAVLDGDVPCVVVGSVDGWRRWQGSRVGVGGKRAACVSPEDGVD
ncbi:hypothetical protein ILUMI_03491, partial [Ignelater luminosus]